MKPTYGVIERIERAARDGDNELLNLLLELVQLRAWKMYCQEAKEEGLPYQSLKKIRG